MKFAVLITCFFGCFWLYCWDNLLSRESRPSLQITLHANQSELGTSTNDPPRCGQSESVLGQYVVSSPTRRLELVRGKCSDDERPGTSDLSDWPKPFHEDERSADSSRDLDHADRSGNLRSRLFHGAINRRSIRNWEPGRGLLRGHGCLGKLRERILAALERPPRERLSRVLRRTLSLRRTDSRESGASDFP